MLRTFISITLSLCITFALFLIMQKIIFTQKNFIHTNTQYKSVDFIRLKPKTTHLEKKDKNRKDIEKKEKQLPKRVTVALQKQNIQTRMPKIDIDPIDIPRNFKNNISLSNIAVEQPKTTPAPKATSIGYSTDIVPIFTIPPNYPRMAKRRNIQGYVILNFTIDTKGLVKDIVIKEAKPKGYFEKSAIEAIAKWRFQPKYSGLEAIEQLAQQKLEFTLR